MKTLLLVAGRSSRFWPLTEKPLFPICGKPLISHIVGRLEESGQTDIIFIGSKHNLEDIVRLYPDAHTVEQKNLEQGMRGALLDCLPILGTEDVLVIGGNDVIDAAGYHAVVEAGKQEGRMGAILGQTVDRYFPGGYLSVSSDRINGIVEKPGEGNEPSNMVNIVCHYHSNASVLLAALQDIDEKNDDGYGYEAALDTLFRAHTYAAVPYTGNWQAVKYPWHILSLLPIVLADVKEQSIDSSADIHPSAVITGPVIIEEGVRVLPHATVVGPAFIGRHSIIGNNALVRQSSVGESCIIGYNTEVKGAVLHSHVWTHSTYIGDSVIGRNVSFGAGSVTGNLRLDEGDIYSLVKGESINSGLQKFGTIIGDNCRLGIHTCINPGIKIGAGSFVSSGVLVETDIPHNSFAVIKKGELVIKENRSDVRAPEDRDGYKASI